MPWLTQIRSKRRFSSTYFAWAVLILAVELFIAIAVDDDFVRPYLGDTLAVILIYVAVLSVIDAPRAALAWGAFGLGCAVEVAQYVRIVDRLGLADVAAARVVIGTHCDPSDFIAYAAALPLIWLTERLRGAERRA